MQYNKTSDRKQTSTAIKFLRDKAAPVALAAGIAITSQGCASQMVMQQCKPGGAYETSYPNPDAVKFQLAKTREVTEDTVESFRRDKEIRDRDRDRLQRDSREHRPKEVLEEDRQMIRDDDIALQNDRTHLDAAERDIDRTSNELGSATQREKVCKKAEDLAVYEDIAAFAGYGALLGLLISKY